MSGSSIRATPRTDAALAGTSSPPPTPDRLAMIRCPAVVSTCAVPRPRPGAAAAAQPPAPQPQPPQPAPAAAEQGSRRREPTAPPRRRRPRRPRRRSASRCRPGRRGADEAAETAGDAAGADAPAAEDNHISGGQYGFMDIRLNFTLTNENILAKPGETIPSVPGWRFGRPELARHAVLRQLRHAVLGLRDPVARRPVQELPQGSSGGRGRVRPAHQRAGREQHRAHRRRHVHAWRTGRTRPARRTERVSLTAFPVSCDRFRLGYSYRLSWGGSPEYRRVAPRCRA